MMAKWAAVEWGAPEADVYPPELLDREQWMGAGGESGKLPFAPWGHRDHPEGEDGKDARWK